MRITKDYLRELIKEELENEGLADIGRGLDKGIGAVRSAGQAVGKGLKAAGNVVARGARSALGGKEGKMNQTYSALESIVTNLPRDYEDATSPHLPPEDKERKLQKIVVSLSNALDQIGTAAQNNPDIDHTRLKEGFEDVGANIDNSIKNTTQTMRQKLGGRQSEHTVISLNQLGKTMNGIIKVLNLARQALKENPKSAQQAIATGKRYVDNFTPVLLKRIQSLKT